MAKLRAQKVTAVSALTEALKASAGTAFAQIEHHTVKDDLALRKTGREQGVKLTVIKRTLIDRAAKDAGLTLDASVFVGTTIMATSSDDALAPAKLLHQFGVTHPGVKLIAALVDGAQVNAEDAKRYALLPTVPELRGQLLSVLISPLRGFAAVVQGPIRGFATVLARRAENFPSAS